MELQENAKENVWFEAIRTMTEKEIAYKANIDNRIAGIRFRQIVCIWLAAIVLGAVIIVLFMVFQNLHNMNDLLNALMEGFQKLKN